jgi:hypothetical protein
MVLSMDRSNLILDISMTNSELLKCEEYLKGVNSMLEWGAGGSTLYFSKLVNKLVSIENDNGWYNKLQPHLDANVDLHYVHQHEEKFDDELDKNASDILKGDGGNMKSFINSNGRINWITRGRIDWHCYMDYIKKPLELEYRDYDIILVDGRARAMCAYLAKDLLKDDGYLLFHDFNTRPYYHGILKWYDLIDTDGSLAVLSKKPKI